MVQISGLTSFITQRVRRILTVIISTEEKNTHTTTGAVAFFCSYYRLHLGDDVSSDIERLRERPGGDERTFDLNW